MDVIFLLHYFLLPFRGRVYHAPHSLSEKGCVYLLFPRQFLFLQFSSLLSISPCCPQPHADPAEHPGGRGGQSPGSPWPFPA